MSARATAAIIVALVFAGLIDCRIPIVFVGRRKQYFREEFVTQHPQFAWLENDLAIDFGLVGFSMLVFAGGVGILHDRPLSLGLFSLVPASPAFANGLLAVVTGVYRVPHNNLYTYLYAPELRYAGWIQLLVAAIVIAAAVLLLMVPA